MARSRKRKKHHPHQAGAGISRKQKKTSRFVWPVLMAVFAVVMGFFATGANVVVLIICAVGGALIGYMIGRSMMRTL